MLRLFVTWLLRYAARR